MTRGRVHLSILDFLLETSTLLLTPDFTALMVWVLVQGWRLMQLGWISPLMSAATGETGGGQFCWTGWVVLEEGCCKDLHTAFPLSEVLPTDSTLKDDKSFLQLMSSPM